MKVFLPIFLLGILMSGRVGASPFVSLPPAARPVSPSVIYFGEAAPEKTTAAATLEDEVSFHRPFSPEPPPQLAGGAGPARDEGSAVTVVSPSVIALGALPGNVDFSQVASLDKPARRGDRDPHLPPMVMRGGIYGDAFMRGNGSGAAPEQPTAAEQPQQQAVTNPPGGAAAGSSAPNAPEEQPAPPPAAIQPPAPPTARME